MAYQNMGTIGGIMGNQRATQPPQMGGMMEPPGNQQRGLRPPQPPQFQQQQQQGPQSALGTAFGAYSGMHPALGMEGTPAEGLGGAMRALGGVLFGSGGGTPSGQAGRGARTQMMR